MSFDKGTIENTENADEGCQLDNHDFDEDENSSVSIKSRLDSNEFIPKTKLNPKISQSKTQNKRKLSISQRQQDIRHTQPRGVKKSLSCNFEGCDKLFGSEILRDGHYRKIHQGEKMKS